MRKKRIKTYEVGIPVSEIWIFRVKATSKKEAFKKANWNSTEIEQIGSIAGKKKYCREVERCIT